MSLTFRYVPLAIALMLSVSNLGLCDELASFDQKTWLKYQNRNAMAHNLIDTSSLIGKTPEEIHKLLGPAHIDYQPPVNLCDVYPLEQPSLDFSSTKFFTVSGLEIHYQSNRVSSLKIAPCKVPNGMWLPGAEPPIE